MQNRYICVHGHFYQPPRENPWLETVEVQDSAYPYHDWNDRITAECYAANAASRILDDEGFITGIVNNYAKISYNFGPTLLAWMETNTPDVYDAVLRADALSRERFSGHGSAMAQAYNHIILPLANQRDKLTQIVWGIRDFESRYGRFPEGMWLPETAVDLESLDIMAEQGLRFVLLSPGQAGRVRPAGDEDWREVEGGALDTGKPYVQNLPGGGDIAVFFYDGQMSHRVAFENMLKDGRRFGRELAEGFGEGDEPRLVHIASDGETYGHHHRNGDMALAYALYHIESEELARLTNYGEFLERHPPEWEVEIIENTSWSCAHGVERWRADCGCNSGMHPGWSQAWRRPLREALDWLRDRVHETYEKRMAEYVDDPWAARNDYISVVLDRSPENVDRFFHEHGAGKPRGRDRTRALELLEMARHGMLMFTSCGWFFDELSGIETVQVIEYAGRAVQLHDGIESAGLEEPFLKRLGQALSNLPEHGDGKRIYEEFVRPAMLDLEKVGAHYAISSLFEDYPEEVSVACYTARRTGYDSFESGRVRMAVGEARLRSDLTCESGDLRFGVIHLYDHNVSCGISGAMPDDAFQELRKGFAECYNSADFTRAVRLLDRHFGESLYNMESLFRDQQREVLDTLIATSRENAIAAYRPIYEQNAPFMRFLKNASTPCPRALSAAGYFVLNDDLKQEFDRPEMSGDTIRSLLQEAELSGIDLDADTLEYTLRKTLEASADRMMENPGDGSRLEHLLTVVELVYELPFDVNLREVQNDHWTLRNTAYPEFTDKAEKGDEDAIAWVGTFEVLAEKLMIRLQ
ncbi:MAG: DUF3536 domain-containing protein [Desulfatibacillaceae bacterium]